MALALKKRGNGNGGQGGGGGKGGGGGGKGRGQGRGEGGGGGGKGGGGGGGGGGLPGALKQARMAALAFRKATGRPLGAAQGLGAAEAARLLGLTLAEPDANYDATDAAGRKLRLAVRGAKGEATGPLRLGKDEAEWQAVVLVMLDARYRAKAIFEADRAAMKAAAGDKPRLPPAEFRKIARKLWEAEAPEE
ncbi:hypothetical protein P2H44_15255 [Albimonas sp. CAU 1670]|uniref:hypothetical protein n=1 Tax=Albimonas sp. CAU 1670 TaxID=3032599 RepID=UPI0023DA9D18|nr:hypothetical protein [Albimonas sp. CAU 1670]MDF2233917.1 hypothetical protein [Albimonas sp. CAU 1670]